MKIADIVRIKPKNVSDSNVQLCNYWWNNTANTAGWVHIKTNILWKSSIMFHLHLEGYNYGKQRAIDTVFTGYTYSGWNGVNNAYMVDYADGVQSQAIYISSDNYVCLRLYQNTWYYAGFVINAMFPCPSGRGHLFDVQAVILNQQDGNHY